MSQPTSFKPIKSGRENRRHILHDDSSPTNPLTGTAPVSLTERLLDPSSNEHVNLRRSRRQRDVLRQDDNSSVSYEPQELVIDGTIQQQTLTRNTIPGIGTDSTIDTPMQPKSNLNSTNRITIAIATAANASDSDCSSASESPASFPAEINTDIVENYHVRGVDGDDIEPDHLPKSGKVSSKNQSQYISEFKDRIDDLLQAKLSREALSPDHRMCKRTECTGQQIAIWRCKDCFISEPVCRSCLRTTHLNNPLHRIERWTGDHFRPAWLSDVGVYLLLKHHLSSVSRSTTVMCPELLNIVSSMESYEVERDAKEQELLWHQIQHGKSDVEMMDLDVDMSDSEEEKSGHSSIQSDPDTTMADALMYSDDSEGSKGSNPSMDCDSGSEVEADYSESDTGSVWGTGTDSDISGNNSDSEDEEIIKTVDEELRQFDENARLADTASGPYTDGKVYRKGAVRIVHLNGIHVLHLMSCSCGDEKSRVLDLVAARLMPASFTNIRTVFTAPLLDFARLSNLELKSSSYQFCSLLSRLTEPLAPHLVPNLYHEFRRMLRIWRWMKKLKWGGFGHLGKAEGVMKGQLANFCPACPQPGVNLPPDWINDANNTIYQRSFVADGNFKADHVQQIGPDISLYPGGGIMPNDEDYAQFRETAQDGGSSKAPCENTFKAIIAAMVSSKSCDRTGVVGIACARHGCYSPCALVDLFKGEQQKNVDYALLQALSTTNVDAAHQQVTLLYDIGCQYVVNIEKRIGHHLPAGLVLDVAIGLFHVHAHKDACFFRFSPTFVPGLGVVVGEILESLWSTLNLISPSLRTSTLSHRAEVLDDHATDSNHRKALQMTTSLCSAFRMAIMQSVKLERFFTTLSATVKPSILTIWSNAITFAESHRRQDRSVMDIYKADISLMPQHSTTTLIGHQLQDSITNASESSVPSEDTKSTSDQKASLDLQKRQHQCFEFAIFVEEQQLEIRHELCSYRGSIPDAAVEALERRRSNITSLLSQLRRYEANAELQLQPNNLGVSEIGSPEDQPLALPSNGNIPFTYADIELNVRIQQADIQLGHIRALIAEKSTQFSHVSRQAPRTSVKTRSYQKVKTLSSRIQYHVSVYSQCRSSMEALKASPNLLNRFKSITKADLKASTAILKPNVAGSTQIKLSWLWHSFHAADADVTLSPDDISEKAVQEFRRVHWLRARALSQRWAEELLLVTNEMSWMVRYFLFQSDKWKSAMSAEGISVGAASYASRKMAQWKEIAHAADKTFAKVNPQYISPVV